MITDERVITVSSYLTHMSKEIVIKSDPETLESLRHDFYNKIEIVLKSRRKERLRKLLIPFVILLICLPLTYQYREFIIILYMTTLVFLYLVYRDVLKRVKMFILFKRTDHKFKKFKAFYAGYNIITYSLSNDKLIYDGPEKHEYKWSEFTGIIDYQDSFMLNHPNKKSKVWIPRLAVTQNEDYDYFKCFASERVGSLTSIAWK